MVTQIIVNSGVVGDARLVLYPAAENMTLPLAFYAVLWPQWWREQQQHYYSNGYAGWRHQPNLAADARGERGSVR